jgi:hypothetical protein
VVSCIVVQVQMQTRSKQHAGNLGWECGPYSSFGVQLLTTTEAEAGRCVARKGRKSLKRKAVRPPRCPVTVGPTCCGCFLLPCSFGSCPLLIHPQPSFPRFHQQLEGLCGALPLPAQPLAWGVAHA